MAVLTGLSGNEIYCLHLKHGSLLEFLAIGTAVKRFDGVKPASDSLPAQAIIRDKDTWIDSRTGITLPKAE